MVNSMLIRERKEEREGGWGEWEVRRVGVRLGFITIVVHQTRRQRQTETPCCKIPVLLISCLA